MTGRLPQAKATFSSAIDVARALLRAPIPACGLALVAAIVALYVFPLLTAERLASWSEGPLFVPLIVWVIAATASRARRADDRVERKFWKLIAFGFLCWLSAVVLGLLPAWSTRSPLLTLAYDGLSVAFYLCLILATTRAPHERNAGASRTVGARLVGLGTAVFGVGVMAYFDVVPFLVDRGDFEGRAPAFYLFLALDLVFISRAAAQIRATPDPGWRPAYALILLSASLLGLGDLLDLLRRLGFSAYTSGTATDFLWYGIYVAMALAPALRQLAPSPVPLASRSGILFGSPLLTYAFILPLVHFSLSGAALLGTRSQHPREAVALATMAAVLIVAWWRQSLLERSHVALQLDLDRERERLRNAERLEAVGRLAGGVAHDFNNQLNVILGYAEILAEESAKNPALAEPVKAIGDAARYAAALTSDLLTVGQRSPLVARVFDLGEFVRRQTTQLQALVEPAIGFELALDAAATPVLADRSQVERALLALVTNAREALPRGGRIRIEVVRVRAPGQGAHSQVELAVADDGCGMTDEVLSHAFEPFFTTKPFGQGSGLGLASVRGIVEQSGGSIAIESAPGRGTRVTVRLPLAGGGAHPSG